MATTVFTPATKAIKTTQAIPMDPTRKTAFVAGAFYLVTFLASIPALLLLSPVLDNPHYIVGSGADTQVRFAAFLDLVNALACIGTAVALFSVVKREHEGLALGFVTTRIFEAAVIVIGVVSLLAVASLRQAGAAGGDEASLITAGQSLVAVRDWTFLLGPGLMAGLNALLIGALMYRSRLVPRVIPVLGLIGAPLLIASVIAGLFGLHEHGSSVWTAIAVAPIFVWELSLGIYLVVKGFKPSPITTGMVTAGIPAAHREVDA